MIWSMFSGTFTPGFDLEDLADYMFERDSRYYLSHFQSLGVENVRIVEITRTYFVLGVDLVAGISIGGRFDFRKDEIFSKSEEVLILVATPDKELSVAIIEDPPLTDPANTVAWLKYQGFQLFHFAVDNSSNVEPGQVDGITVELDPDREVELQKGYYYPKDKRVILYYKEDTNPQNYEGVSYDAWIHNEVLDGTRIRITGEVWQVIEEEDVVLLMVATGTDLSGDYIGEDVLVRIFREEFYKSILAEGDVVTIYGENSGRRTYKTVQDVSRTIPSLYACFYTRHK